MTRKCHFCSRFRYGFQLHQLGAHAQRICDYCLDKHHRALDVLAGNAISGCHSCLKSWETLRDQAPGEDVRLYVVPRDGVLQVLCAACVAPYVGQRRDLYGETAFGAAHGM